MIVECPHCNDPVFIESINCGIFRHAVFKTTNEPINPHSSKLICDELLSNNYVYGCTKPFKMFINDGKFIVKKCDYI